MVNDRKEWMTSVQCMFMDGLMDTVDGCLIDMDGSEMFMMHNTWE